MQVIDNTKDIIVEVLPLGTVFKDANDSIWMVARGKCVVCLAEGRSSTTVVGDVRDITNACYSFSHVLVVEAVLHVTA